MCYPPVWPVEKDAIRPAAMGTFHAFTSVCSDMGHVEQNELKPMMTRNSSSYN